jgi:parallel beta-helix repeat (two copies)
LVKTFQVLDGENKYEIFTIAANRVTIIGLRLINTGVGSINDIAAIKALDCRNLQIINNQFENTFFGIYLANSSHSLIENNALKANAEAEHQIGNGIHAWKCDSLTIRNNTIQGHRDGIYFEFVTHSLIERNHSHHNMRYGLHFMFSHDDRYQFNTFENNGAGVAVMYTKGVTMFHNEFKQNWGPSSYGLLLKDIRDSHVEGNRFEKNTIAIYMEGTSRTHFLKNEFSANGYALRLQASCDDNDFIGNNFSSNTFDVATNGSLVMNKMENNYWDRYDGYDLNHDGIGDVPYRPVNLYSMIVEHVPAAVLLWRSFMVFLLDHAEKTLPAITPENLKDPTPRMRPYDLLAARQ